MSKVKQWCRGRLAKLMVMACVVSLAVAGAASASEGTTGSTDTVISAFQTGFQSMASDALRMIAIIIPIGLSIAGMVFLAKRAMGWFKSMGK